MKQNTSRKERRAANKRHTPTLKKILSKASDVLELDNDKAIKDGLQELDNDWRNYCKKYDERNKKEFPNHDAFYISMNNHLLKQDAEKENKTDNMQIVK